MHGIGWGWWLFMVVGMIAFLGLLAWGVSALVRGETPGPPPPRERPEQPLEILQRRLAHGEISVEEYEKLRDALTDRRPKTPA